MRVWVRVRVRVRVSVGIRVRVGAKVGGLVLRLGSGLQLSLPQNLEFVASQVGLTNKHRRAMHCSLSLLPHNNWALLECCKSNDFF